MRIQAFAAALVIGIIASDALAWNALGHKVVAEIAWRQLDSTTRQSIVDTLRRHPRFDKDFAGKMEDNALTGDKSIEDHWIFLQAAIWPDIIRDLEGEDQKKYDRQKWHYIDLPTFLNPSDRNAFAGRLPVNISTDYPTRMDPTDYNIIQALEYCRATISGKAGPDVKALAYCWLFHLVADIHQPLHCTGLFSADIFPKGDEGGNKILVKRGKNLHSLWDNLLGRASYIRIVDAAALELSNKKRYGDIWASATKEMSPATWAKDSHDVCEQVVYADAILSAVRNAPSGQKLEPIELPENYFTTAGEVARRRIITAGLRLGELLKGKDDQRPQRSRRAVRAAK